MKYIDSILAFLPSLISIFGSGPWGLIGGAVAILAGIVGVGYFINKVNKERDKADLESGGSSVGENAVDLRNQANSNRDYMEKEKEEISKKGPTP